MPEGQPGGEFSQLGSDEALQAIVDAHQIQHLGQWKSGKMFGSQILSIGLMRKGPRLASRIAEEGTTQGSLDIGAFSTIGVLRNKAFEIQVLRMHWCA
jgi:hypothetical protein